MKSNRDIWGLAAVVVLCAAVQAHAQQGDQRAVNPTAPLPPVSSSGSSARPAPAARGISAPLYDAPEADPTQAEPDTHTLSGVQRFSVGSQGTARNIFDPSFSVTVLAESAGGNSTGQRELRLSELLSAQLNFRRNWSRYRLTTTYKGGKTLYQSIQTNTSFHDANLELEIEWNRWRLIFRDDFLASAGAAFGGTGMGGPGLSGQSSLPGSAVEGVGQAFVPTETIQTGSAMRYRNSALVEAEYSFSRRSAITFTGSYGLLDFTSASYIGSRNINAQAGYDYLLDPKNSIAILGGYGKIDYAGTNTSSEDYMAAFAFGHRITGRLAFQAAAGPQQIRATRTANGSFQFWSWAGSSALTYQLRRTIYSASYARGVANGSGVFFGATTDTFSGSVNHQFTRQWSGSANSGYAHNRTIVPSGVAAASFNHWFIGANLGRQLGRHARVNFSYGLQKQDNSAVCPVANCGASGFQHTFGMTVNWHLRPTE